MEWVALMVQDTNGLHCTREGSMDATSDRGNHTIGQRKAFLFVGSHNPHLLTHTPYPVELIAPIEAHEISRCLAVIFLPLHQMVDDYMKCISPCLLGSTKQFHQALTCQALPLGELLVLIEDNATKIKKNAQ